VLKAFSSVGANAFDLTMLDLEGREQGFQRNRSLTELRSFIGAGCQPAPNSATAW
jgi:hypothetical protein